MHGLVNEATEELVVTQFGDPAWGAVCAKAGVDIDLFISNESYDDGITFRLAGAAMDVVGLPLADDILHAFGIHWVHGLAPFVHGLVDGLSQKYETPATIEQAAVRADGAAHDIFAISWMPRAS